MCSRCRFGDGYMITVRTKSSLNIKEVVRFFNRNFPEAILKVGLSQSDALLRETLASHIPKNMMLGLIFLSCVDSFIIITIIPMGC